MIFIPVKRERERKKMSAIKVVKPLAIPANCPLFLSNLETFLQHCFLHFQSPRVSSTRVTDILFLILYGSSPTFNKNQTSWLPKTRSNSILRADGKRRLSDEAKQRHPVKGRRKRVYAWAPRR